VSHSQRIIQRSANRYSLLIVQARAIFIMLVTVDLREARESLRQPAPVIGLPAQINSFREDPSGIV
jgi:hypothetical protein